MKSIPFYLSTILESISIEHTPMIQVDWHFETDLEYLFTISIQYFYSIFRSTFQCHQNEDNRNSIIQKLVMLDLEDPKQIITNQFIVTSKCQWSWIIIIIPSFSPTFQYPISYDTYCFSFLFIHSFILFSFITHSLIQSFIHRLMDHWLS